MSNYNVVGMKLTKRKEGNSSFKLSPPSSELGLKESGRDTDCTRVWFWRPCESPGGRDEKQILWGLRGRVLGGGWAVTGGTRGPGRACSEP